MSPYFALGSLEMGQLSHASSANSLPFYTIEDVLAVWLVVWFCLVPLD